MCYDRHKFMADIDTYNYNTDDNARVPISFIKTITIIQFTV